MATVQNTYIGDGSQTNFSFTFEYFEEADVKVALDNVDQATTEYSFANATTISFNTAPASNVAIRIYRQTSVDDPKAQFFAGSAIRADDLNDNNTQVRYLAQEVENAALSRFGKNNAAADINMGGNKITNLSVDYGANAAADADHEAASKGWVREYYHDVDAETIEIGEPWVQSTDGYVATTGRTSVYVGEALKTALNDYVNVSDGLTHSANDPADGEITIGIGQGSVDLDRIKPEDIVTSTETDYTSTAEGQDDGQDWVGDDTRIATLGALAKRFDNYYSTNTPTGHDYKAGTLHYNPGTTADPDNTLYIYNGSGWETLVSGVKDFIKQNRLIWVDAALGNDALDGHRVVDPMKTIQGAVNKAEDGDMIFVQPGVYKEYLPIDLGRKKNVSIIGLSMRSVFVHPHPTKKWVVANTDTYAPNDDNDVVNKVMEIGPHGNTTSGTSEYETMFQLGSGSFVANMSLAGMKAQGNRGNSHTDSVALNPNPVPNVDNSIGYQGWFFAFAKNDGAGNAVKFQKSPYIQNVTAFADSAIDNTNYQPHSTVNQPAFGGDQTSAPTGGALLVDGSVPHPDSPLRSFLTDAYTLICLDGPGVLVKNEGYAQLVSTFGHFCHYHAKAESGGMINMSNCTTDFGRFGLVADGQSVDSIFEGTVSANSNNNVIQIDATTAWTERYNNTPKPVNHMVVSLINNPSSASDFYPIKAVTEPSSGVYNIELYDNVSVTDDQTVYFYLRSTITTGGHVFEFAGAGTDYRAHPDNGGSPVEANQVKNEGAGKVYISSSDHNGNFKVGEVFNVSTDGASVTITGNASVSGTSTLTGAVTTGGNVTVGGTLDAQSLTINGSSVETTGTYFDSNGDIKDEALPDISGLPTDAQAYPSSVTLDAKGRVTAISAGTEPVTSVNVLDPITGDSTSKTPTIGVKEFGATETVDGNQVTILKGVVNATANDSGKFLKGDGTWASPAQAAYSLSSSQSGTTDIDLKLTGSGSSTVKLIKGTGIVLEQDPNSTGSTQEFKISAPSSANAQVYISGNVPPNPLAGDTWWDTNTGECYLYYTDVDSSQWVQFAPQQRGTGNGTVTSIQVTGGTGISVDNANAVVTSGTYQVSLDNTAVTPDQYGTSSAVPQFSVDQQGRITAVADVNIGSLSTSAISTGTFAPSRIDRTETFTLTQIEVPQGTSDGQTPPTYIGPVTVTCNLANANDKLSVNDTVTISGNTGNTASNQAFLNTTHVVTNVTTTTFEFVIGTTDDEFSALDTATANLGTCVRDSRIITTSQIPIGTFTVDHIPNLSANKITSDTFHVDRIPTLSKSKISSIGSWNTSDIPDLSSTYLTAVSADTSPQLGGSLNVGGNSIISANNGNVTLNPDGTGVVSFANNTGTTYVNGDYGVTIKPPTLETNLSLVLPATDGTAGQYLKTDGSGNLGWATDANSTYTATSWRSIESTPTAGLVPASGTAAEDANKYLAGDGAWKVLPTPSSFDSGMIMWWPGLAANIPSGWLPCDGRVLFHTAYAQETNTLYANLKAALANVQGVSGCIYDDQRTRVAADFPQGTALTTFDSIYQFALPDLRGEFIRGWDNSRNVDPNRGLGSAQADKIKDHQHSGGSGSNSSLSNSPPNTNSSAQSNTGFITPQQTADGADETRPRNIAMIAIIKT